MESYLQVDNVDVGEDQQRVELFFPGEECMQIWNDLFVRGQAFLQLTRHLLRTREQERKGLVIGTAKDPETKKEKTPTSWLDEASKMSMVIFV